MPVVLGSKRIMIIQCGAMARDGLTWSFGSVMLRCVAPASMYQIGGFELIELHCGGSATFLRLPARHTNPLFPSRRVTLLPCASVPSMREPSVTCFGPAERARAICTSAGSSEAATAL